MMEINYEKLHQYLSKYGQEHLLNFWNDLNDEEKKHLYDEIMNINFDELNKFYNIVMQNMNPASKLSEESMQSIPDYCKGSYADTSKEILDHYERNGLEAISNNEVAALLLAGGQGTRLGSTKPKGMYSVNLPSNKTLYQIQAERIIRIERLAQNKYNKKCCVPWYIMTSEGTKDATCEFFEINNYFGLNKENVIFFEQLTLPCLTKDGKIILDSKSRISKAPDGNGGLYKALYINNVLSDMAQRGIKHVHVYCVDNILVKIADPVFIGFCIDKNANCAAKVIKKSYPEEPVGVICKVDNKYKVVEYSEIPNEIAQKLDSNGDLKFNAGNICNHYFRTDFLNMVCRHHEGELIHHVAEKKIPYVDQDGVQKHPDKPNGIKMEKFVFDVFPFSTSFVVWNVLKEDEFSPLKNSINAKKDTPITCRRDLLAMHHRWLISVGAKFNDENKEIECEISPLVSYFGEDLDDFVKGKTFESSFHLERNHETESIDIIYSKYIN